MRQLRESNQSAATIRWLVTAILAGGLGLQVLVSASDIHRMLRPRAAAAINGVEVPHSPLAPGLIVASHLFGAPSSTETAGPGAAQSGPPQLKLLGTLAAGDPTKGSAIIALAGAGARLVAATGLIDATTRLLQVFSDRAVIEWQGTTQTLSLASDRHAGAALLVQAAPSPGSVAESEPGEELPLTLQRHPAVHYANSLAIRDNIDYSFADKGIEIGSVKDEAKLAQQGLKDGDVITEFNGTPVDGQQKINALLKALSHEGDYTATIIRDGQTLTTVLHGE